MSEFREQLQRQCESGGCLRISHIPPGVGDAAMTSSHNVEPFDPDKDCAIPPDTVREFQRFLQNSIDEWRQEMETVIKEGGSLAPGDADADIPSAPGESGPSSESEQTQGQPPESPAFKVFCPDQGCVQAVMRNLIKFISTWPMNPAGATMRNHYAAEFNKQCPQSDVQVRQAMELVRQNMIRDLAAEWDATLKAQNDLGKFVIREVSDPGMTTNMIIGGLLGGITGLGVIVMGKGVTKVIGKIANRFKHLRSLIPGPLKRVLKRNGLWDDVNRFVSTFEPEIIRCIRLAFEKKQAEDVKSQILQRAEEIWPQVRQDLTEEMGEPPENEVVAEEVRKRLRDEFSDNFTDWLMTAIKDCFKEFLDEFVKPEDVEKASQAEDGDAKFSLPSDTCDQLRSEADRAMTDLDEIGPKNCEQSKRLLTEVRQVLEEERADSPQDVPNDQVCVEVPPLLREWEAKLEEVCQSQEKAKQECEDLRNSWLDWTNEMDPVQLSCGMAQRVQRNFTEEVESLNEQLVSPCAELGISFDLARRQGKQAVTNACLADNCHQVAEEWRTWLDDTDPGKAECRNVERKIQSFQKRLDQAVEEGSADVTCANLGVNVAELQRRSRAAEGKACSDKEVT